MNVNVVEGLSPGAENPSGWISGTVDCKPDLLHLQ
jgi:hypothetical protein